MQEAIIAENLGKSFPPTLTGWRAMLQPLANLTWSALSGVSFTVAAGKATAIIGANGAGKSTLLRVLSTLLVPTTGRARVAGFDVERESSEVRRQIGLHAGGDGGFYARLTGQQNLEFFAALNRLSRAEAAQRIGQLADWLGLGPALERQVRTLSTGTVHRLSLARALLHRPSVLFLDEPTRSLDPLGAAEFRKLLREEIVGREGTTLLFSTHSLQEVAEVADRAILLDAGKLVAEDSPAGLLKQTGATTLDQALARLMPYAHAAEVRQ